MYYAEYCPYGYNTISDGDTLYRFKTKEIRDDWVSEDFEHHNAITAEYARHYYGSRYNIAPIIHHIYMPAWKYLNFYVDGDRQHKLLDISGSASECIFDGFGTVQEANETLRDFTQTHPAEFDRENMYVEYFSVERYLDYNDDWDSVVNIIDIDIIKEWDRLTK